MTDKKTQTLLKAKEALKVWINAYAPEFCDEDDVVWAKEQLAGIGTLAYIDKLNVLINEALEERDE